MDYIAILAFDYPALNTLFTRPFVTPGRRLARGDAGGKG